VAISPAPRTRAEWPGFIPIARIDRPVAGASPRTRGNG
jgi:hypothetical protein